MSSQKYEELLDEFVMRLNEERFYDAHESLEEIWFPRRFEDSDEMQFLRGLINAAVSFELIKKGRPDSAKKVWKNYIKHKDLMNNLDSPYLNKYNFIVQEIESIHSKNNIT